MAINQVSGHDVNNSSQSRVKQSVESVDKSKNGHQEKGEESNNPYSDRVSISGKASKLEQLSKELFSALKPEAQIGDVAHKLYEHGFISIQDLNHLPLKTRTQQVESPAQVVDVLQTQAKDLVLQGEDSDTLEGVNKVLVTLKNMTAPSYPASAYQRVTGYGYIGIQ